jgi:hypothetical protein
MTRVGKPLLETPWLRPASAGQVQLEWSGRMCVGGERKNGGNDVLQSK